MTAQPGPSTSPATSNGAELATVTSVFSIVYSFLINFNLNVLEFPEFWCDQPRLWFVQCEAILGPQKLSDEARFNLVVAKLGKDVIQQVSDILLKPPETKKFDVLKERLLKAYEESEIRQFQKLLSGMELGDQKPSQLLRRMKDLAREKIPDETLRIMWQGHLPSSVRAVLAVSESQDLENLAAIADKIMETSRPLQVAEVQSSTLSDSSFILAEIAKLSLKIRDMERSRNHFKRFNNNRSRSRSTSRARNMSRRTPDSPDWLSMKCVEPCAWKKSERKEN
ncbi:hypothetical protein ABMA28_005939 [Loxostege sticticalis]|uniref:DUF7041 domain-containing protein n=1 Tax=Loxostege sticticalis TaxID=481309 RepID=A0ABD0SND2_LOXSC